MVKCWRTSEKISLSAKYSIREKFMNTASWARLRYRKLKDFTLAGDKESCLRYYTGNKCYAFKINLIKWSGEILDAKR